MSSDCRTKPSSSLTLAQRARHHLLPPPRCRWLKGSPPGALALVSEHVLMEPVFVPAADVAALGARSPACGAYGGVCATFIAVGTSLHALSVSERHICAFCGGLSLAALVASPQQIQTRSSSS